MSLTITEILSKSNEMKSFIPKTENEYIYHYTSPKGLKGIIEECKLYFSDRNYLNDKSEGSYVLELLMKSLKEIDQNDFINKLKTECDNRIEKLAYESFHTYQCSFSVKEDSLCLWNYYTKGDSIKGYNLKFDVESLEKSLIIDPPKSDESTLKPMLGEVIYDEEKQKLIIFDIIKFYGELYDMAGSSKHIMSTLAIDKILYNGAFFKNPCFDIEQEFRIVFCTVIYPGMKEYGIPDEEKFREVNGYFVPYIERNFSSKTLREITASPTLDFDLTKKSLERILKKDYEDVKVVESNIPVRY